MCRLCTLSPMDESESRQKCRIRKSPQRGETRMASWMHACMGAKVKIHFIGNIWTLIQIDYPSLQRLEPEIETLTHIATPLRTWKCHILRWTGSTTISRPLGSKMSMFQPIVLILTSDKNTNPGKWLEQSQSQYKQKYQENSKVIICSK